jgi:hypothetical protein
VEAEHIINEACVGKFQRLQTIHRTALLGRWNLDCVEEIQGLFIVKLEHVLATIKV